MLIKKSNKAIKSKKKSSEKDKIYNDPFIKKKKQITNQNSLKTMKS